jgi:methionyl-tRNA formyltransferase
MSLNCLILGTSEFTKACAEGLISVDAINLVGVVCLPVNLLPLNSISLKEFAEENKLKYFEIEDVNSKEFSDLISNYSIDILFSTWPRILSKKTLEAPDLLTIGSHPTALPKGRGRHPIHWLINLGVETTKLTFFKMDEGADTGDIIHQEDFCVNPFLSIGEANENMNRAAIKAFPALIKKVIQQKFLKQGEGASVWRARSIHDCLIDPRMDINSLIKLVNSYCPPYPCAKLIFKKDILDISAAAVVELDSSEMDKYSIGMVVKIKDNQIVIRCSDGFVSLTSMSGISGLDVLSNIHPPSFYITKNMDSFRQLF